jgi:hypothetical protein
VRHSRAIFALTVLKRALYAPILREKVVEVAFDVIKEISDWQLMIDFFIVKHAVQCQKV